MSIYQTIITISRWSITVSSLRIVYSPLPYRGNWITLYRGIGLTVSSELKIIYSPVLNLYRGNWITIYRGIGLTVSSELRIIYHVYSPLLILYCGNLITIYRGIGLTVSSELKNVLFTSLNLYRGNLLDHHIPRYNIYSAVT